MSSLYNSLFTDVFRRPPVGQQAPLQLGEGRSPKRTAYDEATLGLSSFAASMGPGRLGSPDAALRNVNNLRNEFDVPRRTSPQRSPLIGTRTPDIGAASARKRSPVATAPRNATPPRVASPRGPMPAGVGIGSARPYQPPSPLRSSGEPHPTVYPGSGSRAPKRGAVAAEARPPAPAVVDSFGRVPYVVPGTATGAATTSAAYRSADDFNAAETGAQAPPPRRTMTHSDSSAEEVKTPRPKLGSSLSDYERERIKMRNRTIPNRQPVKPRVTNNKLRGDFGLPSELPPARPRIDAATYELREGLHSVAEEMKTLNERLLSLTETHWNLQQESERLRRDIQDAESERSQARQKFEDMVASVKNSVAELEQELQQRDVELAEARAENERLRRGVQVVSEAAKERRTFVDRAMARAQLEAQASQPPRVYNATSSYVPIGSMAPGGVSRGGPGTPSANSRYHVDPASRIGPESPMYQPPPQQQSYHVGPQPHRSPFQF